jgi:hypothetical protein
MTFSMFRAEREAGGARVAVLRARMAVAALASVPVDRCLCVQSAERRIDDPVISLASWEKEKEGGPSPCVTDQEAGDAAVLLPALHSHDALIVPGMPEGWPRFIMERINGETTE